MRALSPMQVSDLASRFMAEPLVLACEVGSIGSCS